MRPLPMSPPNIKRKWRFFWVGLLYDNVAIGEISAFALSPNTCPCVPFVS